MPNSEGIFSIWNLYVKIRPTPDIHECLAARTCYHYVMPNTMPSTELPHLYAFIYLRYKMPLESVSEPWNVLCFKPMKRSFICLNHTHTSTTHRLYYTSTVYNYTRTYSEVRIQLELSSSTCNLAAEQTVERHDGKALPNEKQHFVLPVPETLVPELSWSRNGDEAISVDNFWSVGHLRSNRILMQKMNSFSKLPRCARQYQSCLLRKRTHDA